MERFNEGLDLTELSVSSRGPRAGTCQIKDATSFLKEILTGQASSLILSGLRQSWSRWSQSCFENERAFWNRLKTLVYFQIRNWERSQIFGYRHFQLQAIFSCETFVRSIANTERNNATCGPTENFFKASEMFKFQLWRCPRSIGKQVLEVVFEEIHSPTSIFGAVLFFDSAAFSRQGAVVLAFVVLKPQFASGCIFPWFPILSSISILLCLYHGLLGRCFFSLPSASDQSQFNFRLVCDGSVRWKVFHSDFFANPSGNYQQNGPIGLSRWAFYGCFSLTWKT